MDLELSNKVVLVTGGSKGIGHAVAMRCAQEGASLALCSRDPANLQRAADEISQKTRSAPFLIAADISTVEGCQHVADKMSSYFGGIHVLINNVGGPPPGRSADLDDEQWSSAFDLTFMSAVRLTTRVLPIMRAQRWGRVINIASYAVRQPIDGLMASNSLRLAVVGWAKSLANEVAAENILINTVCPGWISTGRMNAILAKRAEEKNCSLEQVERDILAHIPIRRLGTPAEVANLVTFLASERASYVTGTTISVDGGITVSPL